MSTFVKHLAFFSFIFIYTQISAQESKYDQAYTAYEEGDVELAVQLFNAIESAHQNNSEFYFLRGTCYSELEDNAKALADLSRSIKIKPTYAEAWYQRALTYFAMSNSANALIDFDQTVKLDPSFAEAYMNRGTVKYEMNQTEAACQDWKKAVELGLDMANQFIEQICH